MSVLKQYMVRKGYANDVIQQIRVSGKVVVPPDWLNFFPDEQLMFSHRRNWYYNKQYSSDDQLHAHGCYELVIHIHGETEYIQNDRHIHPKPYTVVWCKPGNMHAVRVNACEYERYLLYFSPSFFSLNADCPILSFTDNSDIFALQIDESHISTLLSLLDRIEETLHSELPYRSILAKALIVELFAFFNTAGLNPCASQHLSDPISEVKRYVDRFYAEISSIDQIAAAFHYSREHLSRKFKTRFNTSISDYLSRRRILESIPLLGQMSITEACFAVGFRSPSVFISAFKKNLGYLPSEYRKRLTKK